MSTSSGSEAMYRELHSVARSPAWPRSANCPTLSQQIGHGIWLDISLNRDAPRMTIGRSAAADIIVTADATASRLHAIIEWVRDCWVIVDNGMSKNGTFVNDERIDGCRRLNSGDVVHVGQSVFIFRDGQPSDDEITIANDAQPIRNSLTEAQYLVLAALCRPCGAQTPYAYPASNCQIAHDLCLSISTVKTHMRALFKIFQIEALPQNQKRMFLVKRAFESGVIINHRADAELPGLE